MYIDKHGNRWYKGNLHTHTTLSDGKKSPEDTKIAYREAGYDFIALTDHWKIGAGNENDPSGLLVLSGCEYNFGGEDSLNGVFHIVGVGMDESMTKIDFSSTPSNAIAEIKANGGAAILAHPAWSLNTWDMLAKLDFTATEIYNSVSGGTRNCRPYSGDVVDALAVRGIYPRLIADDDTHFWCGEQTLSYINVNLRDREFNRENLMTAILAGDYYATQGPKFSCEVVGDEFVVSIDEGQEIERVTFFTNRPWENLRSVISYSAPLTEARYPIVPKSTFVRAEVYDKNGKTGWGQIFKLN